MNGHTDSRVLKTKAQLRRALTTLLKTKGLGAIFVSELTKLSSISRGTFYLHYNNVYDLFEQIENELVSDVYAIFSSPDKSAVWPSYEAFLELSTYICNNAETLSAMLDARETEFFKKLSNHLETRTVEAWRTLYPNTGSAELSYLYAFFSNGSTAVLRKWVDSGMHETPETIALLNHRLVEALLPVAALHK